MRRDDSDDSEIEGATQPYVREPIEREHTQVFARLAMDSAMDLTTVYEPDEQTTTARRDAAPTVVRGEHEPVEWARGSSRYVVPRMAPAGEPRGAAVSPGTPRRVAAARATDPLVATTRVVIARVPIAKQHREPPVPPRRRAVTPVTLVASYEAAMRRFR